jgi:hypothetical protein
MDVEENKRLELSGGGVCQILLPKIRQSAKDLAGLVGALVIFSF